MSETDPEIGEITEGSTTLFVPKSSLNTDVPPRTPAFFNPAARLNRDLSIAAYRVFATQMTDSVTMADVLAGTGARGVRVAAEIPRIDRVYINDGNPAAIELARRAAEANGVTDRCQFSVQSGYGLLAEHSAPGSRFTIVDIDPFGSPAPYLDCALRAIEGEGLLSATATDTATLCGLYPRVAYRRYQGHSLKTEYCHELGVRLLFGSLAHQAMRLELGISPIFAHCTRHYIRTYATIHTGAGWVDSTHDNIGLIEHCFRCGHRSVAESRVGECPECGSSMKPAGPLWIGNVFNREFLIALAEDCDIHAISGGQKIVGVAVEEIDMPPTYFTADQVAADIGVPSPSLSAIVSALRDAGFRASRTALKPKAFKTDADAGTVRVIVKQLMSAQSALKSRATR
jgi:tRNA (guanine26-N2/guanine27-N2)-dimethyltransferase